MMRDYLETQIASRRERLAALDSERAKLVGELTAYQDALANSTDGSIDLTKLKEPAERYQPLPVFQAWLIILQRMADYKHFNASEVMLVARTLYDEGKLRKPQTNDGVRAQLSLYAKKGIIKRIGGGNYQLTDKSKTSLELSVGKGAQADQGAGPLKLVWARAGDSGPKLGG
jgi:hypothetical protein